ncbi:MAG: hypothetical protein AAFR46_13955 [Pseudomonadota bacterium]
MSAKLKIIVRYLTYIIFAYLALALSAYMFFALIYYGQENATFKRLGAIILDEYKLVSTKRTVNPFPFSDPSVFYIIDIDNKMALSILQLDKRFQRGFDSHILSVFEDAFGEDVDFDYSKAKLFLAEIPLGPGTICDRLSCNIYIAVQGRYMLINIWKT